MQRGLKTGAIRVRFFPDYRESNPYQSLLYDNLGADIAASPIEGVADFAQGQWQRDADILHLHWEAAPFIRDEMTPEAFLDRLSAFQAQGGTIVWTIHNIAPHDTRHLAAAEAVRLGLLQLADILHLHSLAALAAVRREGWPAAPAKLRIIPHGNYDGAYPIFTQAAARAALGLDTAGQVVLLPGQIRDYKAPAELARAFLEVAGPKDRLLLRGHLASDVDAATLPEDERVVAVFGFAAPEDLSRAVAASDFLVLPYRQSLTSGTAVLAQTLGRGVLGSDTPGLRDVVDVPRTGRLFEAGAPGALRNALQDALAEGAEVWAARGRAAAEEARARDPGIIGAMWTALFRSLVQDHAPDPQTDGEP